VIEGTRFALFVSAAGILALTPGPAFFTFWEELSTAEDVKASYPPLGPELRQGAAESARGAGVQNCLRYPSSPAGVSMIGMRTRSEWISSEWDLKGVRDAARTEDQRAGLCRGWSDRRVTFTNRKVRYAEFRVLILKPTSELPTSM